MSLILKAGATSQSVYVEVLDSASTTGGRKTGIVFNSAGLTAYYVRQAGSATSITLATLAAANSAYSSGGFKEVDATNMPGVYRLDIPDAAIAAGVPSVVVTLKGAAGMVQVSKEIMLTAVDPQDGVRFGTTALPNAAAEAAGGLYTRGAGAGQINQPANGLVDVNTLRWNGTAVATPATAGVPDVNVKNMNNVAATSITTINANQGTTQPVNFTGAGASALAKSDMVDVAGAAVSTSTAQLGVNAVNWAGGAIPAPAVTGVPKVDLLYIIGSILSESAAGRVVAAFKKFFDIAASTLTTAGIDQTGDAFARLGAPVGASISADIAGVQADTDNIQTRLPAALVVGRMDSSIGAVAAGVINNAAFAADTGMQTIRSNTAAAGGATTITLDAGASATDSFYNGTLVYLRRHRSGPGAGDHRLRGRHAGSDRRPRLGH